MTAAAILASRLLRIELPSAVAVALLTLLVGGEGALYLTSIAISSLALPMLFRLWRRLVYERLVGGPTRSGWEHLGRSSCPCPSHRSPWTRCARSTA